jgi:hypothetical protein
MSEKDLPLEDLEKRLYGAQSVPGVQVDGYQRSIAPQPYGWTPSPPLPSKRTSRIALFGLGAAAFCLLCVLIAAFIFWKGSLSISSDRIDILITPEVSVASGDTVTLVVSVTNDNPTEIFNTTLFLDLPPGSRDGVDPTKVQEQYSDSLGMVASGETVTRTVPVQLFGEQGEVLRIPVRVEYRVPDSNALLVARDEHELTVSSSPITLTVTAAAEHTSGEPFTVTATVRSNATAPLIGVALAPTYPPGYRFVSSDPAATKGGLIVLGDLAPGGQVTARITGMVLGEAGQEKVLTFTVGNVNSDGTDTLAVPYAKGSLALVLRTPTVPVTLSLNRQSGETVTVGPGESIPGVVTWQNASNRELSNVRIEVSYTGAALDTTGTSGGSGFYRSSDRTIVFSSDTNQGLTSLGAGDSGTGTFTLRTKGASALMGAEQATSVVTVRVIGTRDGRVEELAPAVTRTVRVGTTVSLSSSMTPSNAVVGVESTHKVTLTAQNTLNPVRGARVTLQVPQYVRFLGAPAGTRLSFDETTRTVTWNVGELIAHASASAVFSVALLPSASQGGTSPVVVGSQTFTGTDPFAGPVEAQSPALTLSIP